MKQRHAIFGPLLLVAAGVLALLIQSGRIPAANLWALVSLWPLLLIMGGIGLILRTRSVILWNIVELLTVGALFLAVVYAPRLGLPTSPTLASFGVFIDGRQAGGPMTRQERTIGDFNAIDIAYPSEVTLTQGTRQGVVIEAPSSLLPEIKTEVQQGVLSIRPTTGTYIWHPAQSQAVHITINVTQLSAISFSGAGSLSSDGLQADDLNLSISGAGQMTLSKLTANQLHCSLSGVGDMRIGESSQVGDLTVSISGVGGFDGADLKSQAANISISGLGNATVWATDRLDAQISSLGSVRYYGNPSISKHISGIGDVTSLGNK
jgi:hypothetical protein